MQSKKRTITPRTDVTSQTNATTATPAPLNVEIPPETSSNTTETTNLSQATISQDVRREHSPEATTPEDTDKSQQRNSERRA